MHRPPSVSLDKGAHKYEDDCTVVTESFDALLVERVIDGVDVLVVTLLALPRITVSGAAVASELKLWNIECQ
jgi:hypothetical protein